MRTYIFFFFVCNIAFPFSYQTLYGLCCLVLPFVYFPLHPFLSLFYFIVVYLVFFIPFSSLTSYFHSLSLCLSYLYFYHILFSSIIILCFIFHVFIMISIQCDMILFLYYFRTSFPSFASSFPPTSVHSLLI